MRHLLWSPRIRRHFDAPHMRRPHTALRSGAHSGDRRPHICACAPPIARLYDDNTAPCQHREWGRHLRFMRPRCEQVQLVAGHGG